MQTPCLDHLAMKKVLYKLRLFHSHSCGSDSKALSPELGASQGKNEERVLDAQYFFFYNQNRKARLQSQVDVYILCARL